MMSGRAREREKPRFRSMRVWFLGFLCSAWPGRSPMNFAAPRVVSVHFSLEKTHMSERLNVETLSIKPNALSSN